MNLPGSPTLLGTPVWVVGRARRLSDRAVLCRARGARARGAGGARSAGARGTGARGAGALAAAIAIVAVLLNPAVAAAASPAHPTRAVSSSTGTVWLCRPGVRPDPCAFSETTAVVPAPGTGHIVQTTAPTPNSSRFDCFYVYPTVSLEPTVNADLTIQQTEKAVAALQASRFSSVCQVWAPMYHQITWRGLEESAANLTLGSRADQVAYASIESGLQDYLAHYNAGRPIIFIGHSQGASMLILLLSRLVDDNAALRSRLVLAIILGGNVQVPVGKTSGGSFANIPVCTKTAEAGCVIAYSSFPGEPPTGSSFGRPGEGVSLLSGQTRKAGMQVVCVNPADLGGSGRSALLDPYFFSAGLYAEPWVEYPDLYQASCRSGGGATWLQVSKATVGTDHRPLITETLGPDWGYHIDDVNLALGNLVDDVSASESTWASQHG